MIHRAMRLLRAGLAIVVLALTLILAACDSATANNSHGQVIATVTPTVVIPHLDWRKVTTPVDLSHGGASMDVSPVNGRNAWICAPASASGSGRFAIWRTQDAGAKWRQISALAPVAPQPISGCSVNADQNAATGVVVWFVTANPNSPGPSSEGALAYYSADGGADWTAMPQNWWIKQIATSGGVTYALVTDLAHDASGSAMYASSDNLQTWHAINPTSQAMEQNTQFWAAKDSGEMLFSLNYANQIYHSTDYGLHWTQALTQANPSVSVQLATWRGQSAGWLVCGVPSNGPATQTLCSANLGKTWTARKNPLSASGCSMCATQGKSGRCASSAIAADGALYALCGDHQSPNAPMTMWVLYRLPLDSSTWEPIGQAPDTYITMTQTGQVWCTDGSGVETYALDQLP